MKNYADRLNFALSNAGKKPKDLEIALEIPQQTISRLRTGKSSYSECTARIAHYLGVNALWLECGEGEMVGEKKNEALQVIERVPETKLPTVFEICNFLSNPNVDPMDEIMIKRLIHSFCGTYPQNGFQRTAAI